MPTRTRILPIPMGVGPSPSEFYTKAEIDAMLANYAQLATTDLVNYYLKSETYTKAEIEALVGQITSFEVVATLPVSDIKTNVIYLLGPIGSGADRYEEYIYSNNAWVKIGETSIDLSNYVTITQLNTALGFYTTTLDLNTLLQGKQDVLTAGDRISISTQNVISADSQVVSLTQAQYDALVDKDPDIIYIITDATPVTLSTVATTGAYSDLTGTPTLATVATSGSYNDLTNTPSIPTVGTGVVTLTSGGATIGTFGLNDSSNKTIDIPAGGTAVAGTNDGTNWTSITIGTDTYAIPQGGSSAKIELMTLPLADLVTFYQATLAGTMKDFSQYTANGYPLINAYRMNAGVEIPWQGGTYTTDGTEVALMMNQKAYMAADGDSVSEISQFITLFSPTIVQTYGATIDLKNSIYERIGNATIPVTFSFNDGTTATYNVVVNNQI